MLEISSSSLKQLRIIFAVTVFYFLFLIRSWYFIAGIAFIAAISAVSYNFLILNGKGGSIFLDQERIIESFGLVMITTSIFYAGTIFLNSKNSSIPKRIAITKCSIPSYWCVNLCLTTVLNLFGVLITFLITLIIYSIPYHTNNQYLTHIFNSYSGLSFASFLSFFLLATGLEMSMIATANTPRDGRIWQWGALIGWFIYINLGLITYAITKHYYFFVTLIYLQDSGITLVTKVFSAIVILTLSFGSFIGSFWLWKKYFVWAK